MRPRLRPLLRKLKTEVVGWSRFTVVSIVCTVTVAAAAYATYATLWPAMVGHPYFRLRSVKITCDSSSARPGVLASRAGLYEGTSLWEIDPEKSAHALAAASWVRSAQVTRRFPSHVSVEVLRREPIAATVGTGGAYLIDADGIVYREESVVPYPDLPYLTGWDTADGQPVRTARLRAAMRLLDESVAAGVGVSEIHVDPTGVYWLYPQDRRLTVRLGVASEAVRAVRRLPVVLANMPANVAEIRELDLAYPDRAVARVGEGRVQQVLSGLAGGRSGGSEGTRDRG